MSAEPNKIVTPLIIEENMGNDMADLVTKCPNPKCKSKDDLDYQAREIITLWTQRNSTPNQAGRENLAFIPYVGKSHMTVEETSCLRIDYQNAAVNADNIQMQLGGKDCYIKGLKKSSIAAIIIEGPEIKGQEISYHKSRVADAFLKSYDSWKKGTNKRYRIKRPN